MRIVIDLQGAQSNSRCRGIGRYSLSLALAMARNAGEHEIWLALNGAFPESILSIRHAFEGLIPDERIRIFDVPVPTAEIDSNNAWRVRAAEKIREHFLRQLKPDVIHVSSLFEGYVDNAVTSVDAYAPELCTAVTLYDLIPLLNQNTYLANESQKDYYLRKVQSLKNASLLLAISEASRREAIEALQLPSSQVVTISAAADEQFHPVKLTPERIHQLQNQYGIKRSMVMYAPGGFDVRKNFDGLLNAYSMLSPALRAEHQLVIVGDIDADLDARGRLNKLAEQAGLVEDELVITSYISNEELVEFYNFATLFIFPSKHEGFGLPVLEAMACGTPVIGANVTSIPEVINFPDALFDPFSPQAIAEKMTLALSDNAFREKLSSHGIVQAKSFTWDACAKQTIQSFEQLVQHKKTICNPVDEQVNIAPLLQAIAETSSAEKHTDGDLVQVASCLAFNTGRAQPKQLFLDISVIVHGDAKSGIQRVVRSLLREFIENPPSDTDVRPIYFDDTCNKYRYANAFIATFTGKASHDASDEIVDFCQDDIYLALDLNAHLTASVHDFFTRLQYRGIKLYFIVYDILLVQHPEWWPLGTSAIFDAWLRSIAEVSTGLICISEAVAEEVRAWLKLNPPLRPSIPIVSSFHLGADVENSVPTKGIPNEASSVLAALRAIPSFLMVGTLEPRKGHAQTLAAFELLWQQGIAANLVIVGKGGWLVDHLINKLKTHPELNKRLFWLEGISDEYLEEVYAASTCLIAASEGEGFGLPLIEAALHKQPIIARDIPVFREVAGEYAFYFKGLDPNNLAVAITNWLTLNNIEKHPSSVGMPFLSWKESAMQLKKQIKFDATNFGGTLQNATE
jgi:glycosyltransferase involved in cell wall biosynthesis